MQISVQEVHRLLSLAPQDRVQKTSAAAGSAESQAAEVQISPSTQEVERIKQLIQQLPDVREERVQALKAQVENGTYHVSGEDIADLMLRRTLADNTAL